VEQHEDCAWSIPRSSVPLSQENMHRSRVLYCIDMEVSAMRFKVEVRLTRRDEVAGTLRRDAEVSPLPCGLVDR
jgi:hypothetical protein